MTLDRRDRDLVGLTVLALLLAGPKHTYQMHRMMIDTHKDFVTGLPRSMYHAVQKLETAGHIAAVEAVRDEGRPERTVYTITGEGRIVVGDRIERLLSVPDTDSAPFTAALSFLVCITPERAAAALRTRSRTLAAEADRLASDLQQAPDTLPRILLIETEHALAQVRSQLAWVTTILDDIDSGTLAWPDDPAAVVDHIGEGAAPLIE